MKMLFYKGAHLRSAQDFSDPGRKNETASASKGLGQIVIHIPQPAIAARSYVAAASPELERAANMRSYNGS